MIVCFKKKKKVPKTLWIQGPFCNISEWKYQSDSSVSTYSKSQDGCAKKKGVTLTFSVTAANCEEFFYNIIAPILQANGVTAGSPPTTPVSGQRSLLLP